MLAFADKLSNLRSIAHDYKTIGDQLWNRFNAPKEKQAWYYGGIQDALYDLQFDEACESAYWEFVGLYKDVFVKYYLDKTNQMLYQFCDDGSGYCLKKGNPQWMDASEVIAEDVSENIMNSVTPIYRNFTCPPENSISIVRKEAELTEDMWNRM